MPSATKKTLTPRQKQVLDFIKSYISQNDYAPTYEEIGKAVKLSSTATIHNHIKALEKKGYIQKQRNVTRGLVVLNQEDELSTSTITIQVLGKITGTTPLVEGGASRGSIELSSSLITGVNLETCYALEVWGPQLISEGLLSGDIIIFQYTEVVEDGKVYLVVINNGTATIRTVYQQEKSYKLESAINPINNTLTENVQIHGRALLVIRSY
ncbi:repressor LexA [Candidatus Roizmanbacteria bacterium CG22_combo_CG10-13_8_21_14_all_38_20]|uniref:Repressor LexA n=1 Tax=Candidatus Roizmanbacteria bacterium CG22_combo_CG10-13_8_21_14_all_38_20 TaxID=1974862 RepID=A0A2H0BV60_9BACT|nr:repressor LexA [Candidatus Microgenomates bacterium]PIP61563.1 MAG: repressor LexA [Candidatus Roizmanbacteria bacterium CG22_combo_CG10-13_8_21_14_all_38_20]PJC31517.1 MAG: repressor LexA [Candidatus Roizmanbacteria bacterium CG_4_9_14_0_2_um_filter_38_17]